MQKELSTKKPAMSCTGWANQGSAWKKADYPGLHIKTLLLADTPSTMQRRVNQDANCPAIVDTTSQSPQS